MHCAQQNADIGDAKVTETTATQKELVKVSEIDLMLNARNLALAEQTGLNTLTPCPGCAGTLKKVNKVLKVDKALREQIDGRLKDTGLEFKGTVEKNTYCKC